MDDELEELESELEAMLGLENGGLFGGGAKKNTDDLWREKHAALAKRPTLAPLIDILDQMGTYRYCEGYKEHIGELTNLLLKNGNSSGGILASGLAEYFEGMLEPDLAAAFCDFVAMLPAYHYDFSSYRRSTRSSDLTKYVPLIFDYLLVPARASWQGFNLATYLNANEETRKTLMAKPPATVVSLFIARALDQNNPEIIALIRNIVLSDNNFRLLSYEVLRGVARSQNLEMQGLIRDLLLAAKLQEGLRQAILESADEGLASYLILMLEAILKNDLLRYSSVIRAVATWMGFGFSADDKRLAEKMCRQALLFLTDAKTREEAKNSEDAATFYTAIWAESFFDVEQIRPLFLAGMQGEKYRQLVALFALDLANWDCTDLVAPFMNTTDLDVFAYLLHHYKVRRGYGARGDRTTEAIINPLFLTDECRCAHFSTLAAILPQIPKNGHTVSGKPFSFNLIQLQPADVFAKMLDLASFKQEPALVSVLLETAVFASPQSKIDLFAAVLQPEVNKDHRAFLFAALKDKSMAVRIAAVKAIKTLPLLPEESTQIEDLLRLKTGEVRQVAIDLLEHQSDAAVQSSVIRLLAQKDENKRLAGLDILARQVAAGLFTQVGAEEAIALMPAVTERERVLVGQITAKEKASYSLATGLGLFNRDFRQTYPPLVPTRPGTLAAFRNLRPEKLKKPILSLLALVEKHKNDVFSCANYDGSVYDRVFGASNYLFTPVNEKPESNTTKAAFIRPSQRETTPEDQVLADVWLDWVADEGLDFPTLLRLHSLLKPANYSVILAPVQMSPKHSDTMNQVLLTTLIGQTGPAATRPLEQMPYAGLITNIVAHCLNRFDEDDRFSTIYSLFVELLAATDETIWQESYESGSNHWKTTHRFYDRTELVGLKFPLNNMQKPANKLGWLSVCAEMARRSGIDFVFPEVTDLAFLVNENLVDQNELYRLFLGENRVNLIHQYTNENIAYRTAELTDYPALREVVDKVVNRVIEIEVTRGDKPTEVSDLAGAVGLVVGVTHFVDILVALGNETLTRGYIYAGLFAKKDVLSSLLRACKPTPTDTADDLRRLADGRLSDKRLLEAAMYAPHWIPVVESYLGWKGLKSAIWYFHAHTSASYSKEFETEVARFSPITSQEFSDGAFDIAWFNEAYTGLGQERFALLYDCAKYISAGGVHRRAQLFADAVQGKLALPLLAEEIRDKRNKDKLLSYSLVPLAKDRQTDALGRYEFIAQFSKESRQFGAMRRESEAKTAKIALANLARNLGDRDVLRFSWRMELLKLDQIAAYFTPKPVGETLVFLEIDAAGQAEIIIQKGEKRLKSPPASLKKDPYFLTLKELKSELKDQLVRSRKSLEEAMEQEDSFTFAEISGLLAHPVIGPLVDKLVVQCGECQGFLTPLGLRDAAGTLYPLAKEDPCFIAHPYHLYQGGNWITFQRFAFAQGLVQPFKQIFRELYLVNADELAEKNISRRYAGHQVQPAKTVALLKGRGWTVDYDYGLQRVYYAQNLIATLYAMADWFSPADIEPPTLEAVQFYHRETGEKLPFSAISPVIFSEVMRDLDLAVSIAHVGGVDPEASHSTIEMRRVIVGEMLTFLGLANVSIEKSHAKIKGHLGEYTVHLGSGMVHQMGRGALNILPVHSQSRGRIFLPFLDEDPKTAEIVTKIITLAEDKTLKDPTILAQIQG